MSNLDTVDFEQQVRRLTQILKRNKAKTKPQLRTWLRNLVNDLKLEGVTFEETLNKLLEAAVNSGEVVAIKTGKIRNGEEVVKYDSKDNIKQEVILTDDDDPLEKKLFHINSDSSGNDMYGKVINKVSDGFYLVGIGYNLSNVNTNIFDHKRVVHIRTMESWILYDSVDSTEVYA